MGRMRFSSLSLFVAGGLCTAGTAAAQTTVATPATSYERGCRGMAIDMQMSRFSPGVPAEYPVVTLVEPGSPAAVAGFQVGDSIASQDGVATTDGARPRRYAVGDSIRSVVRRGGRNVPVLLVLGRRGKSGEGAAATEVCRPVAAAR